MRPATRLFIPLAGGAIGYALVVRGALTVDLGVGRRVRPLGPIRKHIAASPDTVFDVVAAPYLGKTPRAMRSKLQVLERGSDMVLAAHYTQVGRLTTTTVETVRFERPQRISFRLLRGPVPHVVERFELNPAAEGTELQYVGELGADLWRLGKWWADVSLARGSKPSSAPSRASDPKRSEGRPPGNADCLAHRCLDPQRSEQWHPSWSAPQRSEQWHPSWSARQISKASTALR